MKRIIILALAVVLTHSAYAQPLDGSLQITGGFIGSSATMTGNIDTPAGTLQIDPSTIWGAPATFLAQELLGPGTFTRTHNTTTGGAITRTGTIPPGKTGAYFVIASNGNEYQIFNAWNVSANELNYSVYNITANKVIGGTLDGKRLVTSFTIPAPPAPALSLTTDVVGGIYQECNETGGTTITVHSTVEASGGAVLDRIEWWLDGTYQGNGTSKSLFIPLGVASVEAIAYATDGVTDNSEVFSITIADTLRPLLDIIFINSSGDQVTTAQLGDYTIRFDVSDVCDPAPVASGSAKPVMEVFDGDTITINSSTDVLLPTTAVEVTATAVDASGRNTVAQKVLIIQ